ncbi:DUF2202 domain-containing protein [Planktothrix sp. FACHB-1365]|uniref:DUF2202 domain-containing protein n=1 Tax=Planktothrix sp. FACHB-1365 TaxID=2692855 RepID=UPI001682F3D7|nr:DUF2202 domain-containing protein [Planktothrix sp. FACHB-1365]MBD2484892.1 DUF2202 domain-containing protein [Planktothrix sp. FACHB-1365]
MQTVNNFSSVNSSLDASETEGLLYMREEEKLAHDVYVTLYEQWGLSIFNNIANSEDSHENQIETLLNNYQIEDPVGDNLIGVFVNPDLQQLYNNLIAQGSQSLTAALQVGVLIEETDIADLQERIAQTDNADIQKVYEQLLKGSNNHLSAFTSNLTGETVNTNSSNTSNNVTNQIQETIIDDPLTGGGSNQSFVSNGGGNSAYAANFVLGSSSQINSTGLSAVEQSYLNIDNSFTAQNQPFASSNIGGNSNLSTNDLPMGFSLTQNPMAALTIMQTIARI